MAKACTLCPRNCGVNRAEEKGYCKAPDEIYLARASLHMWEEPCISGENGSGTVFFSSCPLSCVYCQNYDISNENFGKKVSVERLSEIFLELQEKNAHNINLVTPTHYADKIITAASMAKEKGLKIPIVYNTSGYEKEETLLMLKDTVDIFLTDFKYWNAESALKYSKAPQYPDIAKKALDVMYSLSGNLKYDKDGMLQKGVIVRILLLPGLLYEAKRITEYVYSRFKDKLIISLMSQYTPMPSCKDYPEINRKVRKKEYERLVDFALGLGCENVYIQEGTSSSESFIPPFTLEGV